MKTRKPIMNRLSSEKSPYLLKHADNPVDWYPWCEEAFQKAKEEDKPIFLSIGYSSCHWCNVMEEESFRDPEIAKMLNETFVCIKVDREERPDIDNLYMTFCQMMTGSGGWPLTIVMTPDRKPFFAATYIPRDSKFGMTGLTELIPRIRELWQSKDRRGDLISQGERLIHSLKVYMTPKPEGTVQPEDADACFEQMLGMFDEEHGGFGTAPKFPAPHRLLFLLRYYRLRGEKAALIMVEKTLNAMRKGGIYDQIGYGIHRYSTDAYWLVPHFEKMLYDQALCMLVYLEAYEATRKEIYLNTAREIAAYLVKEMKSSEGGFFTSEDADSEGKEGKYYLWSEEQLKEFLSSEEYDLVVRAYLGKMKAGVDEIGYVLHVAQDISSLASYYKLGEREMVERLEVLRKKLLEIRERRVRPAKDDKILADWNGLAIAAFARAFAITGEISYLQAAREAADFILAKMKDEKGMLMHRYRDGEAAIRGFLEDYAFLCWGLVELYEACFETRYLEEAINLKELAIRNFWDEKEGGFYQCDVESGLAYRIREAQEGALPSGNSVMAYVMYLLSRITGRLDDIKYIERMKELFASSVKNSPSMYPFFLIATCLLPTNFREVVIVYNQETEKEASLLLQAVRRYYLPNKVVILRKIDQQGKADVDRLASYVRNFGMKDEKATAYVCTNFSCQLPVSSVEELEKAITQ
ncbi:MAG: thioredoxin domain-containing protein [Conexivisphaerales archaeon]